LPLLQVLQKTLQRVLPRTRCPMQPVLRWPRSLQGQGY
jgi:hypothetical protein